VTTADGSSRSRNTTPVRTAAPAASFARDLDLDLGDSGDDVAALQALLVARGHLTIPPGVLPGYFGPLTQAALAELQAALGVAPAAGYFGPRTRAALGL
jgi:peptidoglycan hydrolase-like protein with peptidoglycan-binding domain